MCFTLVLATLFALSDGREHLGKLSTLAHDVSGNVYAISCNELVIENFNYDGLGPQVFAYLGNDPASGPNAGSTGVDATVIHEGRTFTQFLPGIIYFDQTIRLILPDSYSINETNWLSIWCKSVTASFGEINFGEIRQLTQQICKRKVYCQNLREDYDMCWSVNDTAADAEITLCSNNRPDNYFMGFGISTFPTVTIMFNSDPTLCWRDGDGTWTVQDFYISDYAQCGVSLGKVSGVCMDTRYGGVDNLKMASGGEQDGVSWCTYSRPLQSPNPDHDNNITLTGPQAVVWAMGPVNQGVILQHPAGFRADGNVLVDFANGDGADKCNGISTQYCCRDRYAISVNVTDPTVSPTPPSCEPCKKRRNKVGTNRRFVFTIGSTLGRCGYEKLTNSIGGWGIAWYVDGCLVPELTVKRGKKYTFCVLGGDDPSNTSNYHPLYITDSPLGGYLQNRFAGMRVNETVYAGIENDRALFTGPLVYHDNDDVDRCCTPEKPMCPKGAAVYTWRPTKDTPDLVYYQCATHAFLGWKINVTGDSTPDCQPCQKRRNKVGRRRRQLVFTIGSTLGRCGYETLTNSTGQGIAWYVDGCLIPHLTVKRGKKYTFCVLGGNDSADPSNYNPLYITDSPIGGYFQHDINRNETVYAGIENDKALFTGPLVYHDDDDVDRCCTPEKPMCPKGAAMYTWRPTRDTPDLVYYQSATLAFLGWKINVTD